MTKIRTQKNLIGLRPRGNILQSSVTKIKMAKWIGYVLQFCNHLNIAIHFMSKSPLEFPLVCLNAGHLHQEGSGRGVYHLKSVCAVWWTACSAPQRLPVVGVVMKG